MIVERSRSLLHLRPEVAMLCGEWLRLCAADDVRVLVYQTARSAAIQELEYAKGRTVPGSIVTNARAWGSWHQFLCAWDAVPIRNDQPLWDPHEGKGLKREWNVMRVHANRLGIEWGGDWKTLKDYVHFQVTGGKTIEQMRAAAGVTLGVA